jgi:hypothetical protein
LLVLILSHLTFDGWSTQVFQREFMDSYTALVAERPWLPPRVLEQHLKFAASEHQRVRSQQGNDAVAYWAREWTGMRGAQVRHGELPFARLKTGAARPAIRLERAAFDAAETRAIRRAIKRRGLTPSVFFRAAVAIALHHCTGKRQVAVWGNFANRANPSAEGMIGWCSNAHAIKTDVASNPTVDEFCQQVSLALRQAQQHEALPLPALWQIEGRCLELNDTRIVFDIQRALPRSNTDGVIAPLVMPGGREWIDLDIRVRDEESEFVVVLSYNSQKYDTNGVLRLQQSICDVVRRLSESIDCRTSDCADLVKV